MKVRITFEADDELREALNYAYGEKGKAPYARVKNWFRQYGESDKQDLIDDLRNSGFGEIEAEQAA